MTAPIHDQWLRKWGLLLYNGQANDDKVLDLSQMHIKFQVTNADMESPNHADIRIYNLSQDTVNSIVAKGEYANVVLNAGYQQGAYGAIFQGSMKQFRVGRENAIDTYLDILASDGDIGYNQGIINQTMPKGTTNQARAKAYIAAMPDTKVGYMPVFAQDGQSANLRSKVMFGMARAGLRNLASSIGASWSIQNGEVNIVPLTGYLPGEAVSINHLTGLVGVPERTDEGISIVCLLNPKLVIGGLVKINESELNQLLKSKTNLLNLTGNSWDVQLFNASVLLDGVYRIYVAEYSGDSRGNAWFSHLTCLLVSPSSPIDKSVQAP